VSYVLLELNGTVADSTNASRQAACDAIRNTVEGLLLNQAPTQAIAKHGQRLVRSQYGLEGIHRYTDAVMTQLAAHQPVSEVRRFIQAQRGTPVNFTTYYQIATLAGSDTAARDRTGGNRSEVDGFARGSTTGHGHAHGGGSRSGKNG